MSGLCAVRAVWQFVGGGGAAPFSAVVGLLLQLLCCSRHWMRLEAQAICLAVHVEGRCVMSLRQLATLPLALRAIWRQPSGARRAEETLQRSPCCHHQVLRYTYTNTFG